LAKDASVWDRWCEHVIGVREGVQILCGSPADHEIEANGMPLCSEHARHYSERGERVVPFGEASE